MKIEDLGRGGTELFAQSSIETDALTTEDALLEAQLLGIRFDALRRRVQLLFDCRGAIAIRSGDAALVAIHGVRQFSWDGESSTRRTAWTVVKWLPELTEDAWSVKVGLFPHGELRVAAVGGSFFVGVTDAAQAATPDYLLDDDLAVQSGHQAWDSQVKLIFGTQVNLE